MKPVQVYWRMSRQWPVGGTITAEAVINYRYAGFSADLSRSIEGALAIAAVGLEVGYKPAGFAGNNCVVRRCKVSCKLLYASDAMQGLLLSFSKTVVLTVSKVSCSVLVSVVARCVRWRRSRGFREVGFQLFGAARLGGRADILDSALSKGSRR